MKPLCQLLWACLFIAYAGVVRADEPADPIQEQLVSPEFVIQHREDIGLTDGQVDQIRHHLDQVAAEATDVQKKIELNTRKLAEVLRPESIDEKAALQQLDELLKIQREAMRLHMGVMIRIRNELTAKQ